MKRDLDRLREPFDLLVIGAGIYGAAIAWDATLRGLRVALIDRGDIGGGTSFNNAKTLHGGVRSLQGLRLDELREYVRERRALLRIAPHLVRPLTFVSPALGTLTRNRLAYTAYFRAYDLLARDRNEGVDRALHLEGSRDPRTRRVSRPRSAVRPGARHRRRRLAGRADAARRASHAGLRQGCGREGRGDRDLPARRHRARRRRPRPWRPLRRRGSAAGRRTARSSGTIVPWTSRRVSS